MKEIDGRTLWAEEMVSAEMGKESGERKPLWGVKCQNEQEGQHYPDSIHWLHAVRANVC